MKKMPLIFAALLFAAVAGAQPRTDLIARIHFLGADAISADTNHVAFTNEFCSAEARALESQTLDKLSIVFASWIHRTTSTGTNDGAIQLRPLLDDLLKAEWVFEVRDTTNGSPEYGLAVRLNNERAQLWTTNIQLVLLMNKGARTGVPLSVNFGHAGGWMIVNCAHNKFLLPPNNAVAVETNWLTADLNWPQLAQIFPSLKEFDFPKIQMQVVGRDGNLQLTGKLALAQPLPPLENWRLPASTIHQPLVSFTAVRGAGSWLARQPWMQPLEIQPQPDQLFIWALARLPFQTFAAEPVPDAKAALAQLHQRLSADTSWREHLIGPFPLVMTNNEISLHGLPFITPNAQTVREPAGDFLVGGFFPNPAKSRPLPPEMFAPLSRSNLVYYHWEITPERLDELPQMSQLALMLTRHRQLNGQSVAAKWLDRAGPAFGSTVTEVMQTAPNELAFKRTAPGGLTAIELLLFVNWLEAPQFPALDLRLPPPRVRPGMRPVNLPAMPPGAPASHP